MNQPPYPWQQRSWDTLIANLESDRFPHALLLTGPLGTGRLAFARALAGRLLCERGSGCGECRSCVWYAADNHPDWHVLQPEEDKKSIQIDPLRAWASKLTLSSLAGGRKLALIDPADALTEEAANSLLKTLEEPCGDTVLLLVTSRPERLPATILSRCQQMRMPAPQRAAALAFLQAQETRSDWPMLLEFAGGAPLAAAELAAGDASRQIAALFDDVRALLRRKSHPQEVAERWLKLDASRCLEWLQRLVCDVIRVRSGAGGGELAHKLGATGLPAALNQIKLNGLFDYLDRVQQARRELETPVVGLLLLQSVLAPWSLGFPASRQ